jgi:hypothetical protein
VTRRELDRLLVALRDLELPAGDYAVFGSAPLAMAGIIDDVGDLDVLCRGAAWEAVSQLAPAMELPEHGVSVVSLLDGALTFGTTWAIGDIDPDAVIDGAVSVDGLSVARVEDVIAYKSASMRPKDVAHLEAVARRAADDA